MGAVMTSFLFQKVPHLGVAGFAKNIVIPSSQSASNRPIRFPNQNKKKTKRKQNKKQKCATFEGQVESSCHTR